MHIFNKQFNIKIKKSGRSSYAAHCYVDGIEKETKGHRMHSEPDNSFAICSALRAIWTYGRMGRNTATIVNWSTYNMMRCAAQRNSEKERNENGKVILNMRS